MSSKLKIRDTGISVTDVLELISQGFTYERILFMFKSLTYEDIFHAVKVAKEIAEVHLAFKFSSLEKISQQYPCLVKVRRQYPRAYEKMGRRGRYLLEVQV